MRLSISNIAWSADEDRQIYGLMRQNGYSGLEIAPTRFFPDAPYDRLTDMSLLAGELREKYGLSVCSMQSILYGKDQNLFDEEETYELICTYNIQDISKPNNILSEEYNLDLNTTTIYLRDIKIKTKTYNFSSTGNHTIQYNGIPAFFTFFSMIFPLRIISFFRLPCYNISVMLSFNPFQP